MLRTTAIPSVALRCAASLTLAACTLVHTSAQTTSAKPASTTAKSATATHRAGTATASKLPANIPPAPGLSHVLYSLRYVEIKIGSGALATPGKLYTVNYTGWLRDGTKFDSSVDRGKPIDFPQGTRRVIPGWDTGFEGMHIGGKRRLFIPWQLAYGEQGRGPIPAKADLIFDIELVDVKDMPTPPSMMTMPRPGTPPPPPSGKPATPGGESPGSTPASPATPPATPPPAATAAPATPPTPPATPPPAAEKPNR